MGEPSDHDLLDKIRRGERDASALIYDRYHRRLRAYCWRLLRDRNAAEDVVQDVFVLVMSHRSTLEKVESLRPWLYRVARNRCLHILNAQRNSRRTNDFECVWEETTPLDLAVQNDHQELVREAVGRLKAIYREVIVLREFEGMTYAEIAQVLEEPMSTVKFRLYKAREALVQLLRPREEEKRRSV
jgi:RNA polymerase sigma-70 factor (ECF subfamily)